MWWATRLTFNSYRILRHMTRLLHVSGDTELAKRTLRLYVQIVNKSYQAKSAGISTDTDSNRNWVETLIQGARMLCRVAGAKVGLDGAKEVKEAGSLIEKAKLRLDESNGELLATVDLAEGIWSSLMALKGQWWLQGRITIYHFVAQSKNHVPDLHVFPMLATSSSVHSISIPLHLPIITWPSLSPDQVLHKIWTRQLTS